MKAPSKRIRCHAHSVRTGLPCQKWAVNGATVCPTHGGAAPQVKKAAAERLAELVDPAIETLHDLLASTRDDVRLGAAKDILDRNGYKPVERQEVTGKDGQPFGESLTEEERTKRILAIVQRARERAAGPAEPGSSNLDAATGSAD